MIIIDLSCISPANADDGAVVQVRESWLGGTVMVVRPYPDGDLHNHSDLATANECAQNWT
jgi:hypothetical protein